MHLKVENQPSPIGSQSQQKSVLSNQRGQGTIEYILLLVVVVSIALGALYQFHDAFGKYVDNYFGEYLACLLETGELPNLGAPAGTSCDESFEEYSLENGRPKREDGEVGAVTGTSASENGQGNKRARRASGSSSDDFGRRRVRASRSAVDGSAAKKVSSKDSNSNELTYSSQRRSGNSYDRYGMRINRVPAKTMKSAMKDDKDQAKKKEKKKSPEEEGGSSKKKGLIKVKKNFQQPEMPDESNPFTFGKLLRYLIIAGIIIAIVVFIGGQALQLSKDWE